MLILLSPSKTQDFETLPPTKSHTKPEFLKFANQLAAQTKKLSAKQLAKMMKISKNLAQFNHERYQNFTSSPKLGAQAKQAIFTFKGDVYRDIDAEKYTKKQLDFAQKHLRSLSGLYGILKPLDLIQPYRMEMKYQTKFWQDKLTKALANEDLIINLASNEYSKPINFKKLKATIISPAFKEKRGDKWKIIPLFAKIARGTMANYMIKNDITDPQKLQNFSDDGWKFAPKLSTETEPVFTR